MVSAHNENATSLESTSDVTAITYGYATLRELVTEDITIYEGGTRFAFRLADQPSPSSPPSLNLEVLIPPCRCLYPQRTASDAPPARRRPSARWPSTVASSVPPCVVPLPGRREHLLKEAARLYVR